MRLPLFALLAVIAVAAAVAAFPSRAQPPAFPEFTTVYGRALIDGENLQPPAQPLVAFVNGRACGWTSVALAPDADDAGDGDDAEPDPDAGRTVYAVDARSGGDGLYQLPGCGQAGDAIRFYLPLSGRMAEEEARFGGEGAVRADLSFDVDLPWKLRAPQLANEGALESP